MVVHQPHRLHEGVHRGGAHKGPASLFEVFGQCNGCGRCGQGTRHGPCELLGPVAGGGLEAPHIVRQRAKFTPQLQHALGVVDGRGDLAPVAHDGRVLHQALHVMRVKCRHLLGVEVRKRSAKSLALVQDGDPAQPRLKAFQAQLFKEPPVVDHRKPPFLVVIAAVQRRGLAPPATQARGFIGEQALRQVRQDRQIGGCMGHGAAF